MHPQIRHAKASKCPICAMQLTPAADSADGGRRKLASLQEMLAIALKHNPEVRAASAKVRAAEADLDRTRLEVVQKLIAFREKWQVQQFAVRAAEREAAEASRLGKIAEEGGIARKHLALSAAAKENFAFQRAKLAEVEAELPFLLGQDPARAALEPDDARRKLIREELLPKARQILQLRTREHQSGNASVLDVAAANRQLLELETRLAETNKQKIAAVEAQTQLLKGILAITQQLYKAGEAAQGDVLVIDLELSKLELRLLDLKDE
jgi:outer membrane protein TolC